MLKLNTTYNSNKMIEVHSGMTTGSEIFNVHILNFFLNPNIIRCDFPGGEGLSPPPLDPPMIIM